MLLVEVVLLLGAQLRGKLLQDAGYNAVNRAFLGRVTVPNGDEVRVEADRKADPGELVVYNSMLAN